MTDSVDTPVTTVPIHGGAVAAILKLMDGQALMTLASNRPDGRPHASTLGYVNDGLNLYFVTSRGSEKRRNILADPRVSVVIRGRAEEGEAVGLSIDGQAHEVQDTENLAALQQRVHQRSPDQAPWAPQNEDVVVIKVIPELIKAVAVINGRSRTQAFSLGDVDPVSPPLGYEPSAIARLF